MEAFDVWGTHLNLNFLGEGRVVLMELLLDALQQDLVSLIIIHLGFFRCFGWLLSALFLLLLRLLFVEFYDVNLLKFLLHDF
jgi:hypothetical protein